MPPSRPDLARRSFLTRSAALAAGAALTPALAPRLAAAAAGPDDFASSWQRCPDRVWLGPEFWANPLQDWRIRDGAIECTHAAADRNVHLLVRSLGETDGDFSLSVRLSRADGTAFAAGKGSAGFRIGIRGPLEDFRNRLIFGRGFDAGLTSEGGLFLGAVTEAQAGAAKLGGGAVTLRLTGLPAPDGCRLTLSATDPAGRELGSVTRTVPRERCAGGVALVNNFSGAAGAGKAGRNAKAAKAGGGASPGGLGTFRFADWRVAGSRVTAHPERTFGPLLFSQYTLSGGVLKLSAQLPPLGPQDTAVVRLQTRSGPDWKTVAEAPIHAEARTAAFRLAGWDAGADTPFRLAYALRFKDGATEDHFWTGTIRRDPVDAPVLSVADISCNIHDAFPNSVYVANMARLNPDLLAFTGDQFYESTGGYGVVRAPVEVAMIDYLRKWYVHGWTWRELMRDRPVISLPDDHDVYQGNLWGEGGAGRKTTQAAGGYDMPAAWVNVVYRTQTSHQPDPYDATPSARGTIQYFGALTYGRVSFAVLADRQYKSGPEGKVPPTGGRGDHETNPNYDPKTSDVPGLSLLGAGQEEFLRTWVRDWRGAELKAVISQTVFTAFPTTHGRDHGVLRADYDSNGWPQTPRNRAVREMRRAFAFHLAGDQHIPGVVQYGVDAHRDGPVAFAGPAVNVGYPRWFEPDRAPWTKPQQPGLTGDFTDSFGHPMTVLAVRNGAIEPRTGDVLQFLEDKSSGIGIVRFDKRRRRIRIECWPFRADVTQAGTQFPGWPVEIDILQNYGKPVAGHLPAIAVTGAAQPLFEVFEEAGGELLYALRPGGAEFRPPVFAAGRYRVRISDPESGRATELAGLASATTAQPPLTVQL
jgi:hypothetical protein